MELKIGLEFIIMNVHQNKQIIHKIAFKFYVIIRFFVVMFGLSLLPNLAHADTADFDKWMQALKVEALESGISDEIFTRAMEGITFKPKVVSLDRNQPEKRKTLDMYLERAVSQHRTDYGRNMLAKYDDLLNEIATYYNVQPRFIVALWGVETSFGRYTGGFRVTEALATLAYDGRRSAFFRKELLHALRILEDGHIAPENMLGSWAGAMGQSQFMPSSFLAYAVDWDKDGRKDIWTTQADIFASIANYLSSVGWRDDITWGREVRLPLGLNADAYYESRERLDMQNWRRLGIVNRDGSALPARNLVSRLVIPDGPTGRAFLAYANYEATLRWNRSHFFAISVGLLSDSFR